MAPVLGVVMRIVVVDLELHAAGAHHAVRPFADQRDVVVILLRQKAVGLRDSLSLLCDASKYLMRASLDREAA
jgi:hypothetical protein